MNNFEKLTGAALMYAATLNPAIANTWSNAALFTITQETIRIAKECEANSLLAASYDKSGKVFAGCYKPGEYDGQEVDTSTISTAVKFMNEIDTCRISITMTNYKHNEEITGVFSDLKYKNSEIEVLRAFNTEGKINYDQLKRSGINAGVVTITCPENETQIDILRTPHNTNLRIKVNK